MSYTKNKQLHIKDVKPDDSISVTALMGEKKVELSATFASLTDIEKSTLDGIYGDKYVPIEQIELDVNGKQTNVIFEKQNSVLEVVVVNASGVFKFKNVRIVRYTFNEQRSIQVIHALTPKGMPHNRRRGIRINIDTRMTLEQNDNKYIILCRDISYCGFSFINLSPDEINVNQPFLLHLIERNEDKSFNVGKFIGKVQRVEESDNGAKVYGCILHEKHAAQLQKYIAMKQMEMLNGKKAFDDIKKLSTSENWRADVADALSKA